MSQPLRVLQLIDSLAPAGAEQSLASLAPHLAAVHIEVHVAYLIERGGLRSSLLSSGVPVHSLAAEHSGRQQWLVRAVDLIAELRPSIVHTTLFEADLAGRRAAAQQGIPCVSSLVNTAYGRTESSRAGGNTMRVRAAQAADVWTARHVTRFHAVTRHVASVMSRRLLVPRRKIDVIPRGRDVSRLGHRTMERRGEARERLAIADDVPLILAVGRHEPQKGFDVLLEAVPVVRSRIPEARVIIAGREGRATHALAALAHKKGLEDVVTFLGMRDDVPDLMAAADVLAFPSLWEGAAGTLQEAMALECPIVTSRLPTILETVDEATAELVSPNDPHELARGLLAVLTDTDVAAARARAGRKRFVDEFTIDVCAMRMAAFYSRACSVA